MESLKKLNKQYLVKKVRRIDRFPLRNLCVFAIDIDGGLKLLKQPMDIISDFDDFFFANCRQFHSLYNYKKESFRNFQIFEKNSKLQILVQKKRQTSKTANFRPNLKSEYQIRNQRPSGKGSRSFINSQTQAHELIIDQRHVLSS